MSQYLDKVKYLEKQIELISKNMIDAVWVVDAETLKYEYITDSIEKISGFPAEAHIGKLVKDKMSPESYEMVLSLLNEEVQRYQGNLVNVRKAEVELNHRSGNWYWAEIRARLFKDPDGCLKVIGITRDITLRKSTELEKDALIEQLEKTLSEKEKLVEENILLRQLLPMCCGCRRIRDSNGKWWPLEAYVEKASDAKFSHTLCSDCQNIFYGKKDD